MSCFLGILACIPYCFIFSFSNVKVWGSLKFLSVLLLLWIAAVCHENVFDKHLMVKRSKIEFLICPWQTWNVFLQCASDSDKHGYIRLTHPAGSHMGSKICIYTCCCFSFPARTLYVHLAYCFCLQCACVEWESVLSDPVCIVIVEDGIHGFSLHWNGNAKQSDHLSLR